MRNIVKIKGQVIHQFFPKNKKKIYDGDYGILRVEVTEEISGNVVLDEKDEEEYLFSERKVITVKGECMAFNYIDCYTFLLEETESSGFGVQYDIMMMFQPQKLETNEHVKTFLSQILTPIQTEELIKTFDNPIEILENHDIKSLKKVKGIGAATSIHIIEKYENNKDYSKAYVELGDYGLTAKMIKKIIKNYKSPEVAINKIKSNIYVLADEVDGIGFKKADAIAKKNGISKESDCRIEGWLLWYLKNSANSGDSYVSRKQLFHDMFEDLKDANRDILKSRISTVFNSLYDKKVLWWDEEKRNIGLFEYLTLEKKILSELTRLNYDNKISIDNLDEKIKNMESSQGWVFTDEQKNGIQAILNNNLTFITGLGGTGKSTVVTSAVKLFGFSNIAQVALAGRAAQRMFEMNGIESFTIHKLLGILEGEEETNAKVEKDLLIIDEASMIGGDLFYTLLRSISGDTRVVILGDNGQLTPIGKCNVFSDVLNSSVMNTIKLTQIHRQAKASGIISSSINIRNGKQLFKKDYSGEDVHGELKDFKTKIVQSKESIPAKIGLAFKDGLVRYKSVEDVQVVVALKEKGDISTFNLNKSLQRIYNAKTSKYITISLSKTKEYNLFIGDKVINMKNNYNTINTEGVITPIFNGNIGIVKSISDIEIIINFVGIGEIIVERKHYKNIELAYAVTTHKLQGSSAKYVICAFDYSAFVLLNREMIYTAITRAEKECLLIGQSDAIRHAISHSENKRKNTHLQRLLLDTVKQV